MYKPNSAECSTFDSDDIDWSDAIGQEKERDYFRKALDFVSEQRQAGKVIYPASHDVFNAFKLTPFSNLKAVIIGQDPYHGPGQAHGLCFSVPKGLRLPPSLQNIYREIESDLAITMGSNGDLSAWASQGVLLLNTVLTVEQGKAHSHKNTGWEQFTDQVIARISELKSHVVFLLWGSHAQKKIELIDQQKHTVLCAPHPSPLSAHRGFFGCRHFSKCNRDLESMGIPAIRWSLADN